MRREDLIAFARRDWRSVAAMKDRFWIEQKDLVVTKVLAGRPKDIEDVRGVLRERADSLDLQRIRELLRLLEEALGQSDLLSAFESEIEKLR